jgi:multidrug efflux pump subunit AcrB
MERISDYFFTYILKGYAYLLDIVLRFRWVTLLVALATVVLTVYLFVTSPTGFFPDQDTGRLQVTSEAPTDTSFGTMVQRQIAIAEAMINNPDVSAVVSAVGASTYNPNVNQGRFFIELKPLGVRKHSMAEVIAQMNKDTADIRGVTFYPRPQQDINIGARVSKGMYQYALSDINVAELNDFAPKLVAKLKTIPQLLKVTTDQVLGGLEARLTIDRDAAARYKISPSDIDAALYNAFGQRQIAIMYTNLDQLRVVLEVDPKLQTDPSALEKIYVASSTGQQVPLKNLAKITSSTLPLAVNHQGQFPSVTIS